MFAYRVLPKLPSLLHGLILMLGTAFVPSLLKVCGFCDHFLKFNSERGFQKTRTTDYLNYIRHVILETDYGILLLPISVKNLFEINVDLFKSGYFGFIDFMNDFRW